MNWRGEEMVSAAGAAGRAPHAKLSRMLRIGGQHRRWQLDHDGHVVEAADVVERLAGRTERARGRVFGSWDSGPVTGFRSGTMRKNCSRSMKNGSSRGPANSWMPDAEPSIC